MPNSPIVMPKMSMTMTEGELISYTVSIGQEVKAGDVVAHVATDKIDMEVESEMSGKVIELCAQPNQMINVGDPIIILETEGEDLLAGLFTSAAPSEPREIELTKVEEPAAEVAELTPSNSVLAMPGARVKARALGIDLTTIKPKSPSGVIQVTDLVTRIDPIRRAKARAQIAKVTMASAQIPQFTVVREVSIENRFGKTATKRCATLLRAWQRTLSLMPHLHVTWQNDAAQELTEVKVAVAMEAPYGFVTPVISVPSYALENWELEVFQVIENAAIGKISLDNLSGATTSLTDLGDYDVLQANVMLIPPQATALSVGKIRKIKGNLKMNVGLTMDHRVGDPGDAAKALVQFEHALAEVI